MRADAILWGALVAHLWVRRKEPTRGLAFTAWIAAACLLAILPFGGIAGPFLYRGGLVVIDIACAVVVLAVIDGTWKGRWLFELKPFVALGVVSYGFYLWHFPVFFGVRHFDAHWPYAVRIAVATALTVALTLLSWVLIERPMIQWKDRLEGKRHARSMEGASPAEPPAISHYGLLEREPDPADD